MLLTRVGLFCRTTVLPTIKRNLGITAPCLQTASDPIQKLFVDKIHEYSSKSKAAGGKLVDMSPEMEKNLHDELEKLARQYGAKSADFTKFPTFSFTDPDLEPVGLQIDPSKIVVKEEVVQEAESKADEEDKPWFTL